MGSHNPQFNITIIGAGIGGLAAATILSQQGHHIHVLESLAELSEVGAGIQITPNALRIFDKWGLKNVFYRESIKNEGAEIRRYDDGRVLGRHRGNPVESYGYL
jgi:salicylate hydroxylase